MEFWSLEIEVAAEEAKARKLSENQRQTKESKHVEEQHKPDNMESEDNNKGIQKPKEVSLNKLR